MFEMTNTDRNFIFILFAITQIHLVAQLYFVKTDVLNEIDKINTSVQLINTDKKYDSIE